MANIVRRGEQKGSVSPFRGGGEWEPFRAMRDLLRWDPFAEMAPFAGMGELQYVPQFDVKETRDAYVFKADMPGVKESELDISLSGNRLTVSGKREAEERSESDTYYAFERSYGTFTRSFTLPEGIDQDHVNAELKNGVLTLVLAKLPEAQPKKISIKGIGGKETGKA